MATQLLFPHLSIGYPGGLETKFSQVAKPFPPAPVYSWFVQIRAQSRSSSRTKICNGEILSENEIITAAHCLFLDGEVVSENNAEVWVTLYQAGLTTELEVTDGLRSIVHPGFVLQSRSMHDIAVLLLKEPLPPHIVAPDIAKTPPISPNCSVIVLRQGLQELVSVNLWSFENCLQNHTVTPTIQICASDPGNSIRPGDSGSPLLCPTADGFEQLCGIVSYGFEKVENFPLAVVYTSLSWQNITFAKTQGGHFRVWVWRNVVFEGFLFLFLVVLVFGCAVLFLSRKRQHAEPQEVNSLLN